MFCNISLTVCRYFNTAFISSFGISIADIAAFSGMTVVILLVPIIIVKSLLYRYSFAALVLRQNASIRYKPKDLSGTNPQYQCTKNILLTMIYLKELLFKRHCFVERSIQLHDNSVALTNYFMQ